MQKRKLGLTEFYSKFCHDYANGSTLLSGMVRIQGPLTSDIIAKALHIMQKRHAILRSYFIDSSKKGYYLAVDEERDTLPLTIVKRVSDVQWKDVIEKSSMTMFAEKDGGLWRIVFLEESDNHDGEQEIVVTFHHAISDGISISAFFEELIHYFICIFTNVDQPGLDELPMILSVEDLLVKKIGWWRFLFGMILSAGKYIKYKQYLNRFEQYAPLGDRRHGNIYRELDDIQALQLAELCKENNTTLTALISAALTRAVFNVNKIKTEKSMQLLYTPVNVRERCNPVVSRDRIGCYVDFIDATLVFGESTSLWELSRSFRRQLMNGIESGGHMPRKYSKALTMNIFSNMGKGMFKEVFQYGIGVTNIGKINLLNRCGPYTIKYFSFCTGRQWGDWMVLLHTATIEKRMYLCFCFAEPLVSRATIDSIADQVVDLLTSLDKE